jgi:hypothetical protein
MSVEPCKLFQSLIAGASDVPLNFQVTEKKNPLIPLEDSSEAQVERAQKRAGCSLK